MSAIDYIAAAASLRACSDPQKRHAADLIDALLRDVSEARNAAADLAISMRNGIPYAEAAFRAVGAAGCDLYDALNGAKSTDDLLKLVRAAQAKLDALPDYEIGTQTAIDRACDAVMAETDEETRARAAREGVDIEANAERCRAMVAGTRFPLGVMAGAEWNILDATGARVAICATFEGPGWQNENAALARLFVHLANRPPTPVLAVVPGFEEWTKTGAGSHSLAIAQIAEKASPSLAIAACLRLAFNAGRMSLSQGTAVGPDSAKSPCACPEDRCLYPCRDGEFCRRGWMREAGSKS